MSETTAPFLAFLRRANDAGGFGTEDVLAVLLPLFEQVSEAHQLGRVAPLDGIAAIEVVDAKLRIDPLLFTQPKKNLARVEALQRPLTTALEVVAESRRTADVDEGSLASEDLWVADPGAELVRPSYLPGYISWEHRIGHHDQLADIFSLGQILASCACGLDFSERADVEVFAQHRDNLFALNAKLHPVVASMISQMTELNRHRRVQTVDLIIQRLRRYRDQSADFVVDFTRLKGYRESAPTGRSKVILTHLRNRLFEISRRNRLIHFKPTLQTLNLTLASVPLLLDHRNIQPTQLFIWHDAIAKALAGGESIVLGKYVRFEDAPYASGVLDQIIATERRDRQEFGFAQLRLVICFLRWHNLKDTPQERIHSPLLLLPVELVRKKGVRDAYVLKPLSSEAEVNPALRHHLRQIYGLALPEKIDLAATTLDRFHELLAEQIRATEPGVTLLKQDRPQIELIHEKAKQRLDQFRRRQRIAARGQRRFESFDYSYDCDRFRPLGVQLFQARVKPSRSPFAEVTGKPPAPRELRIVDPLPTPNAGVSERESQLFAIKNPEGSSNPYQWEFDLCSQTLGNFNYRKMSLVQDYAALLEQESAGKAFESIFTQQPKARDVSVPSLSIREQVPVIDCDPTQTQAVARARTGQSYIIQGPPGTGKSQTITNLIADYVARGKRVLFVCEKRAAIDVVFHRLGRQGLNDLCCLIHDSQTDKREFIRDLKETYEKFLREPIDESVDARRNELVGHIETELAALKRWTDTLESKVKDCSLTVRGLLARLVELRKDFLELDSLLFEQVPAYGLWTPHAAIVRALSEGLRRIGGEPVLARHSFRHLTERALNDPHPLATITAAVDESEKLLAAVSASLVALEDSVAVRTLNDIEALVAYADTIAAIASADALELLNPRGSRARKVGKAVREWRAAESELAECRKATFAWREKLTPQDTLAALDQARAYEKSAVRFVRPAFWQLRKTLRSRYDFGAHAVQPAFSRILQELTDEHAAVENVRRARAALTEVLGELDAEAGVWAIESLPKEVERLSPAARSLHEYLLENSEATYAVEKLAPLKPVLGKLREYLGIVMSDYAELTRAELEEELKKLRQDLVWLPDILPVLADVFNLPEELRRALARLPLSSEQLESAMGRKSLAVVYQSDRTFEATDGRLVARRIGRLDTTYHEWLTLNARWLHQQVRREFLRKIQLSTTPASQLTDDEKELKRLYATGRRELEHEFSKSIRHRSIRDLADDETGIVLRDLKPVWLMSPLSVSDTLPLTGNTFDVVIFDEASQILVEEAIPAVYRAEQVIVVGDEMQLPPTNFFSATRADEEPLVDGDDADAVMEDLDADSFLTQSARNLSSTMLGWHYRSRYESLISYSNHAFYDARLLTVPDRELAESARRELIVKSASEAVANVDELLARPISFHFHPEAVYERRSNTAEAETIAILVRELLARKTGMSLGVVAFSEAQQAEIESALSRLGSDDAAFRNQLEEEYEREEQGQFCGLFVKNLENVQGDERDIILLSVCYGYDRNRRMLMNFGPINQRGGEKRLNVIFSRARQHMAVISSIRHFDITNDYNDGANCLRNFLEYAAACSVGDEATARRVLNGSVIGATKQTAEPATDGVAQQVAAALRERGLTVEMNVGQSEFRLALAVRRPSHAKRTLGVLIDGEAHFAQRDLLERYLLRPSILRAFGWHVVQIFTKDWFHDPDAAVRQIEEALDGVAPEPIETAETLATAVPEMQQDRGVSPAPLSPSAPGETKGAMELSSAAEAGRYFVSTQDGSSKFWEVRLAGPELTVRFGRIGTKGQSQTKTFANVEAATREQEKLIRSKTAKGYAESASPVE